MKEGILYIIFVGLMVAWEHFFGFERAVILGIYWIIGILIFNKNE